MQGTLLDIALKRRSQVTLGGVGGCGGSQGYLRMGTLAGEETVQSERLCYPQPGGSVLHTFAGQPVASRYLHLPCLCSLVVI